ncbi:MAG: hypothetical protein NVSMB52_03460 [Chloroflexota bacterium]
MNAVSLLMDGAMGTELIRHGLPLSGCLDAVNLSKPALIRTIHQEYRSAGVDILTTNTFGANPIRLHHFGYSNQVREINIEGAKLAREAAGDGLVAGCIGPTGEGGPGAEYDIVRSAYREQARWLDLAGVDLFSCETFGDVSELRAAVQGILDVSSRPIFAQMTYTSARRTPMGLTAANVVSSLADLPITGIGVNCAVGAGIVFEIAVALSRETNLPLIVQPNAGPPTESMNGFTYSLDAPAFAAEVLQLNTVAKIVGGCCGTTPEHMHAARLRMPNAPLDTWTALGKV